MKDFKGFTSWQFLGVMFIGGMIFEGVRLMIAAAASGKTEDERWAEDKEVVVIKEVRDKKQKPNS